MDNSPVPGVSVFGSCVDGGDGGSGRWSASDCALILGVEPCPVELKPLSLHLYQFEVAR